MWGLTHTLLPHHGAQYSHTRALTHSALTWHWKHMAFLPFCYMSKFWSFFLTVLSFQPAQKTLGWLLPVSQSHHLFICLPVTRVILPNPRWPQQLPLPGIQSLLTPFCVLTILSHFPQGLPQVPWTQPPCAMSHPRPSRSVSDYKHPKSWVISLGCHRTPGTE